MTYCMLAFRPWALLNIYLTWLFMENPFRGISSMWAVLVANDTHGYHTLMMRMPSFSWPRLVHLTRYTVDLLACPSWLTGLSQYLEEDPRINRIDDSLQLFTQICSNALLKNVHLVLFLSEPCQTSYLSSCRLTCPPDKTDLLKSKIDKGLRVRK